MAGQRPTARDVLYALGALAGGVLGAAIDQCWMSQRATRLALAAILLVAEVRLLLR